jgi:integrase
VIENQHRPSFTGEQVTAILKASSGQQRVLYALLAGSGMRIGEALGLEVGKHVSSDCRTVTVGQSLWNGTVQSPKTKNAYREIDLDPALAAVLKDHIGDRVSGFLFQGREEHLPVVSQSSILKRSLHPILAEAGYSQSGFHAFRRFRVTWLRTNRAPEDLTRFWIGHGDKSVTDGYSKIKEDVTFRTGETVRIGLGFDLPKADCTNDTKIENLEVAA